MAARSVVNRRSNRPGMLRCAQQSRSGDHILHAKSNHGSGIANLAKGQVVPLFVFFFPLSLTPICLFFRRGVRSPSGSKVIR